MKVELEFTELRLTEAQRTAFLERVRAAVSPEDYGLIQGMTQGRAMYALGSWCNRCIPRISRGVLSWPNAACASKTGASSADSGFIADLIRRSSNWATEGSVTPDRAG